MAGWGYYSYHNEKCGQNGEGAIPEVSINNYAMVQTV